MVKTVLKNVDVENGIISLYTTDGCGSNCNYFECSYDRVDEFIELMKMFNSLNTYKVN